MSITLMSLAWKSALASGRKMVLLALCDWANDQGECYPSVSTLAIKCSMGERTVQGHIADMEDLGIIRRIMRSGRSTLYYINSAAFPVTPAESAPPQNPHHTPANVAGAPPQKSHPTPATAAPISTTDPSSKPPLNSASSRGSRLPHDWTLPQDLTDWTTSRLPGITDGQLAEMADGFRDYWTSRPGQGGTKLDWAATWRNWVRNARVPSAGGGGRPWWNDDDSILAKGKELGLEPNRGERMPQFRGRVQDFIERGGRVIPVGAKQAALPLASATQEEPARSGKPEGLILKNLVRKDLPQGRRA